jgi:hypothetical protein
MALQGAVVSGAECKGEVVAQGSELLPYKGAFRRQACVVATQGTGGGV